MESCDFKYLNVEEKPTIEELADQICSLMPEDMLRSQNNKVSGRTVTFRDKFIEYCGFRFKKPKYTLEESKPIILKILEGNIYDENGEIDLTVFEELLVYMVNWVVSEEDDDEEELEKLGV